jgi:hypothetical protein
MEDPVFNQRPATLEESNWEAVWAWSRIRFHVFDNGFQLLLGKS